MLLADVVATSAAVGATRARTAKTAALAALLRAAPPDEVEAVTAWLAGEPRQGRIGAGWRTLTGIDAAPVAQPTLTVARVDTALDALAATSGAGSTARRAALLGELFGAAVAASRDCRTPVPHCLSDGGGARPWPSRCRTQSRSSRSC